jgi:hypothetical protein
MPKKVTGNIFQCHKSYGKSLQGIKKLQKRFKEWLKMMENVSSYADKTSKLMGKINTMEEALNDHKKRLQEEVVCLLADYLYDQFKCNMSNGKIDISFKSVEMRFTLEPGSGYDINNNLIISTDQLDRLQDKFGFKKVYVEPTTIPAYKSGEYVIPNVGGDRLNTFKFHIIF